MLDVSRKYRAPAEQPESSYSKIRNPRFVVEESIYIYIPYDIFLFFAFIVLTSTWPYIFRDYIHETNSSYPFPITYIFSSTTFTRSSTVLVVFSHTQLLFCYT